MLFVPVYGAPYIDDPDFFIEEFVNGVRLPTSIHFINDDMLILEKDGNVRLVRDGVLEPDPVLSVNVDALSERGLLGITSVNSTVFLYYTEANINGTLLGNRIYQYDWNGSELINKVLLHNLPANKDPPVHNGGAMVKGLDDTIYAVIGDAMRRGLPQNIEEGNFDDTSVILIVDKTGSNVTPSDSEHPDQFYYAIGIRNSFGLAIDSKTGNLWDAENGPDTYDEINLVEPKFNSGWRTAMGPISENKQEKLLNNLGFQYSDPEFSWQTPVAPTDLTFVDSDVFKKYEDYLLVGNFNRGEILKFKLNDARNGFVFDDPQLQNNVLNTNDTSDEIKFAEGFSGITSVEFGPDGFLYVASLFDKKIFRIVPSEILNKEVKIPDWYKINIDFWLTDKLDDSTFISGLKYLIENNILVPSDFSGKENQPYTLDSFKQNAESWVKNKITNDEFGVGIEFLIGHNLIHLDAKKIRCTSSPTIAVDFSGCNLSGMDFSRLDISHSNFTNTDLSNAKFIGTDLRNTDFSNAIMTASDLKYANLQRSNLTNADLTEANLFEAQLKNADASYAILVNVDFSNSQMQKIILIGANLEGSNLTGTLITNANLSDANLKGANLSGASLRGTLLQNVNFENATTMECGGCP